MKVIKRDLDTNIDKLTIIPISDVHIGDKTANIKAFKEVLEIKGKYEELKEHPEIKYVYVYETKPYIDITPKITW